MDWINSNIITPVSDTASSSYEWVKTKAGYPPPPTTPLGGRRKSYRRKSKSKRRRTGRKSNRL
jgi:hypothetical protein